MIPACTFWLLAYGEAAVKNGVVNVSLHRAELRPVLVAGDDERNSIRANEITVTLQWSLSVLHSLLPSQTSQSAAFPENPGLTRCATQCMPMSGMVVLIT